MPRSKDTPKRIVDDGRAQHPDAPSKKKSQTIDLRVRHPGGSLMLSKVGGSLSSLWTRLKTELKAPITTASFRDEDGRPVSLLSNGEYPAGGMLAVGPDTDVVTMLSNGDMLTVSTQGPSIKKTVDKKLAWSIEGPSANESLESIASSFVNSHVGPESLMGTASTMYFTQQGSHRITSCTKGLARVIKRTTKRVHVAYKTSPRAKEYDDQVRLFSLEECHQLILNVLNRTAGSRRRRLTCDKPSIRLLNIDSVASRCPALFWSLYVLSLPKDDPDAKGDVPYMLEHLIQAGIAKFKEQVQADNERDLVGDYSEC